MKNCLRGQAFLSGAVLSVCLVGVASGGSLTQFTTFGDYDAAVGSSHDDFLDFETTKDGDPIAGFIGDADGNGTLDVIGSIFSHTITFSSPDHGTFPSYVNIGTVAPVGYEIGPMGTWDGALQIDLDTPAVAAGWTGISAESTATVSFYKDGGLVESVSWIDGGTFDFNGFVMASGVDFDRIIMSGEFYAIDGFYVTYGALTVIPAPLALPAGVGMMGMIGFATQRRRRD